VFPCKVLRYSALAAGVFYGLYHQASLSASAKLAAVNREYEHKQSLIEKAKAEYSRKKNTSTNKTESGDSKSYGYIMIFHSFIVTL
jgi:F-type H+-transporting ATP synthase subunit e